LSIACGPLLGVDHHLEIALRSKYADFFQKETELIVKLNKMLNASITTLRKKL